MYVRRLAARSAQPGHVSEHTVDRSGFREQVADFIFNRDVAEFNAQCRFFLFRQIRAAVKCPLMVVGGFRSFEIADKTIQESADYIAMVRPFIR